MNKKVWLVLGGILALLLGLLGYFLLDNSKNNISKDNDNTIENNNSLDNDLNKDIDTSKTVVIYFSATGTTKRVASSLSSKLGSDLVEIVPKEKYSASDLDYNNLGSRVSKEHEDTTSRPEIENKIDLDKYDTVYLGYPIWWSDAPRIIYSFLDNYDLSKKNLYLFSTSASSGISTSVNNIKNYQKDLNILGNRRFGSSFKDSEIEEFIKNNK